MQGHTALPLYPLLCHRHNRKIIMTVARRRTSHIKHLKNYISNGVEIARNPSARFDPIAGEEVLFPESHVDPCIGIGSIKHTVLNLEVVAGGVD